MRIYYSTKFCLFIDNINIEYPAIIATKLLATMIVSNLYFFSPCYRVNHIVPTNVAGDLVLVFIYANGDMQDATRLHYLILLYSALKGVFSRLFVSYCLRGR